MEICISSSNVVFNPLIFKNFQIRIFLIKLVKQISTFTELLWKFENENYCRF